MPKTKQDERTKYLSRIVKNIKILLEQNSMNIEELANRLGCSRGCMYNHLNERPHLISTDDIYKISRILNSSPEWVMFGSLEEQWKQKRA